MAESLPTSPARRLREADRIDYPTLAELRYRLRRFLRSREVVARASGIEPQQYLVLLQIKGLEGRGMATIGVLAERLQIHHHGGNTRDDRTPGNMSTSSVDMEVRHAVENEGIREVRGPRRHFTHSKVMTWVALDGAVKAVERFRLDGSTERWRQHRQQA